MFNLFKTKETAYVKTIEAPIKKQTIVEEIHETFFTEVDKLLEDAKIAKSLDTDKQDLIDKCKKLKSLGFNNTKEVKEAEAEISRLDILKKENETKKEIVEAINYFGFTYPNYKFITEDSVKKICKKYGLVYGSVSKYIGTVPDKNLKHIQEFKIKDVDKAYGKRFYRHGDTDIIDFQEYSIYKKDIDWSTGTIPMRIAAVAKDFDMTNSELKEFEIKDIVKEDPIVLQPVMFKSKQYYLIVTAWGPEASDEIVVNQKMN